MLQNLSCLFGGGCVSHCLKSAVIQILMNDCECLLIFISFLLHGLLLDMCQRHSFYRLFKAFCNRFSHILGIYPSFHRDTPNLILIICQTKRLKWEVWIAMSNNQKKFWYHLLEENQFRLWAIMLNCKAKEQERIWEEGIYTLLSVFL